MAEQIKLYIGAGRHRFDKAKTFFYRDDGVTFPEYTWLYLDAVAFPGIDIVCDLTKEIALPNNSVDFVYSQDCLEHLPADKRVHIVNEIWRVLKPNGLTEHYIPNAGSQNAFGSPSHISFWNLQIWEHFDLDSYRWELDHEYEGFIGGFRKVKAELVNWQIEEDGIRRAQSIHVIYRAVK